MVTIQEQIAQAESQIAEARTSQEEQEATLELERARAGRIRTPPLTVGRQFSLAQAVGAGGVSREQKRQQRVTTKQRGQRLQQLAEAETRLQTFGQQIQTREQEVAKTKAQVKARAIAAGERARDIRAVNKAIARGDTSFLTKSQKRLARETTEGKTLARKELILSFEAEGLTPVFGSAGQLFGFESEELKQSIPVESLQRLSPQTLLALEKRGAITFETPKQTLAPPKDFISEGISLARKSPTPKLAFDPSVVSDRGRVEQTIRPPTQRTKEPFLQQDPLEQVSTAFDFGARQFVNVAEFIEKDLGLGKALAGTPLDIRVSRKGTEEFISETAKLTFFSPTFTLTSTLEKQLGEAGVVEFLGTAATTEGGLIRTETLFDITRAGITRRGAAKGISKLTITDEGLIFRTAGVGGSARRGIQFPTGKEIFKDIELFGGKEFGFIKSFKEPFFGTGSVGKIGRKLKVKRGRLVPGEVQEIESLGLGVAGEKLAFTFGQTKAPTAASFFKGLTKRVSPRTTGIKFDPTGIGQAPSEQILKQAAETQLKELVSASIISKPLISPKLIIPITRVKSDKPSLPKVESDLINIPRSVGGRGLTDEKLREGIGFSQDFTIPLLRPPSPKERTIVTPLQSDLTLQAPLLKLDQSTRLRQKLKEETLSIAKQIQNITQIPVQKVTQVQRQRQKLRQKQITIQEQKLQSRFGLGLPIGFGGRRRPFLLLPGFDVSPPKRRKAKGKRKRIQIAPSFTGVALAGLGDVFGPLPKEVFSLGILPGQTRFVPGSPRKTKKKKAKKK